MLERKISKVDNAGEVSVNLREGQFVDTSTPRLVLRVGQDRARESFLARR